MLENPVITVVICSYNRARYIQWALQSLDDQTFDKNKFEVIVVDNNSTDNTEDVCKTFIAEHPNLSIRYTTEKNQGSSFARNHGASISRGDILVFMDDDAIAENNFIEKINDFFNKYPGAAGLGGRIIPKYIPKEPEWMSFYVSSLVGNFDYSPVLTLFSNGKYPLESNMAVRKNKFMSLSGFNTDLPGVKGTLRIGGEGKDFFYRLLSTGDKIYYDPEVIVEHVVETEKLDKAYLYRVASGIGRGERIRIGRKNKIKTVTKLIEYILKLGAAILLAILYTIKGKPSKGMPVIRFRIDAIKGFLE